MDRRGEQEKRLLGEQTEEALMAYIPYVPFQVGERIPSEVERAQRFGEGSSTIREAVKGLVSKGILEVRRGSGTYVTATRLADQDPLGLSGLQDRYKSALELLDVRLLLEPEIAALAAEYATEGELEELKKLCAETEQLYRDGKDHIPKDIQFHTCIAKCSKNRVVETLVPLIHTAVTTFADLTQRALLEETIQTHRAIVDAVADRDPVGARCAMTMHLTYNRQAMVRRYKEQQ